MNRLSIKIFLKSEEFFDLLIKTFEAAVRTRHNEKTKYYAKILRSSIINDNYFKYEPEEYLEILSELSLQELEFIKTIYNSQNAVPQKDGEDTLAWANRCGWEDIVQSYSMKRRYRFFIETLGAIWTNKRSSRNVSRLWWRDIYYK